MRALSQNGDVFKTQSNNYEGAFFWENNQWLVAVNYLCKKASSQMFDWVLNTSFNKFDFKILIFVIIVTAEGFPDTSILIKTEPIYLDFL